MAELYCLDFEYGGHSSSDYNLILANVGTERITSLAGGFAKMTVFDKRNKKAYLIDDNYAESPITYDVDIVTKDGSTLSYAERRAIEKWLFNKHNYRKLYFDGVGPEYYTVGPQSKRFRYYLNCRFLFPEKLEYNGGIVGYKVTMECDSMMFWQDPMTYKTANKDASAQFTVTIDTDIDDYVYPDVTIEIGSEGGEITVVNQSDSSSRITKFVGVSANEKIVMKGDINYISSNADDDSQVGSSIYEKFINTNFIRMLDGANTFTTTGDVKSITLTWQNRRFL